MKELQILNGKFHAVTTDGAVAWARDWIRSGHSGYMCTVNVAILMSMRSDPRLQRFVDHAALTVADGVPLVWISRRRQPVLPERVAGVELVEALSAMAAEEGFKVYLLGATRDVIDAVSRRLQARFPGLTIVGAADGYFGPEEAADRARAIRASGAELLIAGMGVPRQENFLEDHWDELGVKLAIPVGGSFDVVAGKSRRAPRFLQRVGLEWLYRLVQEPRRLGKRYLETNTRFLWLLVREFFGSRPVREGGGNSA